MRQLHNFGLLTTAGNVLNPGGITESSRWLSVFCDTTGLSTQKSAPRQGCQILRTEFLAPLPGCKSKPRKPVVSQKTLNHRLLSAIPPGLFGIPFFSKSTAGRDACSTLSVGQASLPAVACASRRILQGGDKMLRRHCGFLNPRGITESSRWLSVFCDT